MKYVLTLAIALSFPTIKAMYHQETLTSDQISQKRVQALKSLAVFIPCFCTIGALYGLSDSSSESVTMANGALTGLMIAFVSAHAATDNLLKKSLPTYLKKDETAPLLPM